MRRTRSSPHLISSQHAIQPSIPTPKNTINMAIFSLSSSSKGSSDKGAVPPTYEQSQSTSPEVTVTLPNDTATPEQVRAFLVQLLTTKRGLPEAQARRIANKWTTSSGKDLLTYGPSWYTYFFGRENGCIVFKEVKTLVYQQELDERNARSIWIRTWTWIRTSELCTSSFDSTSCAVRGD